MSFQYIPEFRSIGLSVKQASESPPVALLDEAIGGASMQGLGGQLVPWTYIYDMLRACAYTCTHISLSIYICIDV